MKKCKCNFPNDIVIKPDGINELDPCDYEVKERYVNVSIEISVCKKCGNVDISWYRQSDTEEVEKF